MAVGIYPAQGTSNPRTPNKTLRPALALSKASAKKQRTKQAAHGYALPGHQKYLEELPFLDICIGFWASMLPTLKIAVAHIAIPVCRAYFLPWDS